MEQQDWHEARFVLARAKVYLAEHGWCQFRSRDDQGRYCAGSAIDWAANYYATGGGLARLAFRAAVGTDLIVGWNDTPGRTYAEVDEALALAVAYAAKREATA